MRRLVGGALFLFLLVFSGIAGAAGFEPGTPYYFENFDPAQNPWEPGQDLNIEEVFKNYQYFEIVFSRDGKEITVSKFIQNRRNVTEKYLVLPDRSLRKADSSKL
ncbi:MAG: hypothetical protein KGZ83_16685 [Sulfuricella sp.]|nr:hypothetical protein [Sulfuricella sp.]